MKDKKDNRLEEEVKIYNALNSKKKELELEFNQISQQMFKVLGKIELLQDLDSKEKKDKK